ncbi:MAG: pitrilysin family protein, partial [Lysobacterales bacterium]
LARRTGLPMVQMNLELGGGFSADAGRKLGTSSFTMAMLGEGAGELGALEFAAAVEALGGSIVARAALDNASIQLATLKEQLDPLMALYADVVLRPRFEPAEIERVRAQWLAAIAQEKTRPQSLALRLLPPLIYGHDHAYGIPFTGSGTEVSVAALQRNDLLAFHRDWVRPDNATLVVVGDITMAELKALLASHLGDWQAPEAALPEIDRHAVALPEGQRVFLVDQPGASQANILLGHLLPPTADEHSLAFDLANDVFGGTFTARLNMNLREDKGWSYGAHGSASNALGQRPWLAYAPVQIDRTADAISEIVAELSAFVADRPASAEEIEKIRNYRVRRLPGAYETGSAVLGAIAANVRYDRPDDYIVTSRQRIEAITDARVRAAGQRLRPDALTWVVVGDLTQIEAPVRALALGPVQVLDSDGQAVTRPEPAPANEPQATDATGENGPRADSSDPPSAAAESAGNAEAAEVDGNDGDEPIGEAVDTQKSEELIEEPAPTLDDDRH